MALDSMTGNGGERLLSTTAGIRPGEMDQLGLWKSSWERVRTRTVGINAEVPLLLLLVGLQVPDDESVD